MKLFTKIKKEFTSKKKDLEKSIKNTDKLLKNEWLLSDDKFTSILFYSSLNENYDSSKLEEILSTDEEGEN